jgi:hypothetical protein
MLRGRGGAAASSPLGEGWACGRQESTIAPATLLSGCRALTPALSPRATFFLYAAAGLGWWRARRAALMTILPPTHKVTRRGVRTQLGSGPKPPPKLVA